MLSAGVGVVFWLIGCSLEIGFRVLNINQGKRRKFFVTESCVSLNTVDERWILYNPERGGGRVGEGLGYGNTFPSNVGAFHDSYTSFSFFFHNFNHSKPLPQAHSLAIDSVIQSDLSASTKRTTGVANMCAMVHFIRNPIQTFCKSGSGCGSRLIPFMMNINLKQRRWKIYFSHGKVNTIPPRLRGASWRISKLL